MRTFSYDLGEFIIVGEDVSPPCGSSSCVITFVSFYFDFLVVVFYSLGSLVPHGL